jgi:cyanophycinase-like exopeptidase
MPDFRRAGFGTLPAFGIVPAAFIMPHFDAIPIVRQPLVFTLQRQLKEGESLLGLDEETALIGSLNGEWRVHGHKTVSVISRHDKQVYAVGEEVKWYRSS